MSNLNEIKNEESKVKKNAFFTLVMLNENYAKGAIALAKSFKKHTNQSSNVDFNCMVTPEISTKCRNEMKPFFNYIVEVPLFTQQVKLYASEKQRKMYSSWMSHAPTKWSVLLFEEYEKVAFIDADTIFMQDCTSLFSEVSTPAATWTNPRSAPFCKDKSIERSNPYLNIKHNQIVDKSAIESQLYSSLKLGCVASGCLVVLTPSKEDYHSLCKMVQPGYGYLSCSGIDEQSIVDFYHRIKKQDWHHIHQAYQYIPWKEEWLKNEEFGIDGKPIEWRIRRYWNAKDLVGRAKILHYFNIKPWEYSGGEWDDLKYWNVYRSK